MGSVRAALGLLVLIACASPAEAQFPDLVDLSGQYMPPVALEDPQPVQAQVASYDFSLNVPIVLGAKTFLIPGFGYHSESVSYTDTPDGFEQLRAFHAVDLSVLFVQLLPNDWSLSLRLAPGLAGDFQSVDSGMLRINALALVTHGFSERFVLGGGALAAYSFGTWLPLPALYMDWQPMDGLQFETFLPAFAHVKYTIANRVEFGVRTEVAGNAYAIRDARIAERGPCVATDIGPADRDQCFDHVAYSVATAGLVVGVRLFETVWLHGYAGHSYFRRFEQMNEDDTRIREGLQSLPNGWLVRAGVTWRLPRE